MRVVVCGRGDGPLGAGSVGARLRLLGHEVRLAGAPDDAAWAQSALLVDDAPADPAAGVLLSELSARGCPVYLLHPAPAPLLPGAGVVHGDLTMLPLSLPDSVCDGLSVGVVVERAGAVLLLERARPPFAWAPPAGHVDDDATGDERGFLVAAARELQEEVGLGALALELQLEGTSPNPCRRGGTSHHWRVYAAEVTGEVVAAPDEALGTRWASREDLLALASRTALRSRGLVGDQEWRASPGLEPIWVEWLTRLGYLPKRG